MIRNVARRNGNAEYQWNSDAGTHTGCLRQIHMSAMKLSYYSVHLWSAVKVHGHLNELKFYGQENHFINTSDPLKLVHLIILKTFCDYTILTLKPKISSLIWWIPIMLWA